MSGMSNRIVKYLISLLAVLNIVAMMAFEYGLPLPVASAKENSVPKQVEEEEIGTIEAVAKETAEKEAEAAETALAREESEKEEEEVQVEEEARDPEAPVLELTDSHIYLRVGERFNYMSYIKTMEDVDGSDLSHFIYLDRDVDTSEPGEIELTYRITSPVTGKSDSRVLQITIRE